MYPDRHPSVTAFQAHAAAPQHPYKCEIIFPTIRCTERKKVFHIAETINIGAHKKPIPAVEKVAARNFSRVQGNKRSNENYGAHFAFPSATIALLPLCAGIRRCSMHHFAPAFETADYPCYGSGFP